LPAGEEKYAGGKGKNFAQLATPAKDGRRAAPLKTPVFQPFLAGERTGEEIACKYKLV
jgi:hypothetical protein